MRLTNSSTNSIRAGMSSCDRRCTSREFASSRLMRCVACAIVTQGPPVERRTNGQSSMAPEATAVGNLARVRELIEKNHAQANSFSPDGFPVVALAAFLGHREIVEYLAAHGADINAVATNGSGYNALTGAVSSGHAAVVQWLLEHGANPNYRYSAGYSPLLTAAANGRLDIARLLLAHGADPHATTSDGKSALDLAIERNHPQVAALFQARAAS